ncbi:MAG: response regulator [Vitreoscilla sp.]|nr:response regulator [Burkholderiales bacterium]MBP6337868.1 response regulator [Vitreoscilla sp.]MBP6674420.1 response regulator [Vitreoscilla sp.]
MGRSETAEPPDIDSQVRHELLVLALRNAGKSVPLLLVAGAFIAYLGYSAGAQRGANLTLSLMVASAVWRLWMARIDTTTLLPGHRVGEIETLLRLNAVLAGVAWATAVVGIYSRLDNHAAIEFLMMYLGSVSVAAHFMTMVPWSYPVFVFPAVGAMALVSLLVNSAHSVPVAVLSLVYAVTMLRAGQPYRETAARAIAHRLEAEAANGHLRKAKEDAEAANEALVKAKEAAEAGALAKSQFLATMSHEIRTPMNGVLGSLEMLRRTPLNDEQRHLVRTAGASGQSLMAILNDVLDHAKIEAGKLTLQQAPLSLRDLAAQVVGLFRANAESKGLNLKLHCDEQLPDWVIGDAQRLKQVLLNLVSNAIKFTDRGGVNLGVACLANEAETATVLFEVQDTGVGIAEADVLRLFAPFSQLAPVGARSRRGTGLGLTISQRIVEAMGGQIEVASEPGMGSTFLFAVTLLKHHAAPPPPAPDTVSSGFDLLGPLSGTVLVVEDDPVNRLIARSQLESLGMTVLEAQDGMEALALAQTRPVDIVFMDCHMPTLDGYATTQRWREREAQLGLRRTPIVALTANAYDDDIARTREAGMDGHLTKPYTRAQMKEQLQAWL